MQSISLYDEVILQSNASQILITCNHPEVPLDERNTVYKAIKLLKEIYNIQEGIKITIHKQIPLGSGMAGGSTNAAAVLWGLNKLWGLNMTIGEMMAVGKQIGADIPFCLVGGTALVEGIGERITQLPHFKWHNILLVKPKLSFETASVYEKVTASWYNHYQDNPMIHYIQNRDYDQVAHHVANTLEGVIHPSYPEIERIKKTMMRYGALSSLMTGSGSTIFGLFENEEDLLKAKHAFSHKDYKLYKVKTVEEGLYEQSI